MQSYDVLVIGGGIIGGSIAFRLAQQNLRVALLDQQEPGREASWAAAGMLSPAPDCPASIPLVPFGRASLDLYPAFIEEVEEISEVGAYYRSRGAIELIFSEDAERQLSTLVALHHALGLPTEPLPLDEALKREPAIGREARAAALLPYEASVDNRALTEAVLAAAAASGAALFPDTRVTQILSDGRECSGVIAGGETYTAGNVVLAAGAFLRRDSWTCANRSDASGPRADARFAEQQGSTARRAALRAGLSGAAERRRRTVAGGRQHA